MSVGWILGVPGHWKPNSSLLLGETMNAAWVSFLFFLVVSLIFELEHGVSSPMFWKRSDRIVSHQ